MIAIAGPHRANPRGCTVVIQQRLIKLRWQAVAIVESGKALLFAGWAGRVLIGEIFKTGTQTEFIQNIFCQ